MANIPFLDDPSRAALNQFGLDRSIVQDAYRYDRVPRTRTRTSHGLLLYVDGGKTIGAVNAFAEEQSRQIDQAWELHANAVGGHPADLIPQQVGTRTLRISRFDLFTQLMEEAFGSTELVLLSDQYHPFSLRTSWSSPTGGIPRQGGASIGDRALNLTVGALGKRVYEYSGCYFSSIGRNVRADGDRIVNVDAQITFLAKTRLI